MFSVLIFSYDGIEWRFFKETTRHWEHQYILRDFSKEILDPWERSLQDLEYNISDMAMCSIWMTKDHYQKFDLSNFNDLLCNTFVVPKPTAITQASLMYLPLNYWVWIAFLLTLILSAILLNLMSIFGKNLMNKENYGSQFNIPLTVILDLVGIVTSHGLPHFPVQLPIKVLIMSWTFFSLLLTTGYMTGYTTLLTIPRYTKPIETLSDFLEQGVQWGEPMKNPKVVPTLLATENPEYIELARRVRTEESFAAIYKLLGTPNYGRFIKVLSKSFVTETENYIQFSENLKTMSQCIFEYYSTFAFQKQSPFRKIIDRQIPRWVFFDFRTTYLNIKNLYFKNSNLRPPFDLGILSQEFIKNGLWI